MEYQHNIFHNLQLSDINYIPGGQLGTGGFGSVSLVTVRGSTTKYAFKRVDLTTLTANELDHMKQEIKHHLKLSHPNIIKFNGALYEGKNLYMVLDYASKGDLYGKMQKVGKFDEYSAAKIIYQILQALVYIHDRHIIHRDLKPENILLNEEETC